MNTRILTILAVGAAAIAGAIGTAAQDLTLEPDAGLGGSTWRLVSLGAPGGEIVAEPDSEITLNFAIDGDTFEGHGGCNNYSGTAATDADSTIALSGIVSTKMACANAAMGAQETTFLTALQAVTKYRLAGDRLILWTEDGQQLNFAATGAYALINSQWLLVAMGSTGAPAEIVADTVITLEFPTADEVVGYGGCNGYNGSYRADDEHISVSEVIATLLACEDSAVMDQELFYFELLPLMTAYEIGDGRLVLRSEDGLQEMIFVPSGAYALRRSRWQLTGYTSGGEMISPLESAPVTIEFTTPTDVGGSGGCNSFGGTYTVEDDALTFGDLASTLMACEDAALMDQEAWFLEALAQTERYEITDDNLILHTADEELHFVPVSAPVVPGVA